MAPIPPPTSASNFCCIPLDLKSLLQATSLPCRLETQPSNTHMLVEGEEGGKTVVCFREARDACMLCLCQSHPCTQVGGATGIDQGQMHTNGGTCPETPQQIQFRLFAGLIHSHNPTSGEKTCYSANAYLHTHHTAIHKPPQMNQHGVTQTATWTDTHKRNEVVPASTEHTCLLPCLSNKCVSPDPIKIVLTETLSVQPIINQP